MSVLHRFRHHAFIRTDIGPTSADGLLLSGLLNDFESKKENLSYENYIYDQEYFDTFNIYDQ